MNHVEALLKHNFCTATNDFINSVDNYERFYPLLFDMDRFHFKIKIGLCILHSNRVKESLIFLNDVLEDLLTMETYKEHTLMPKSNEMAPDLREQLIHEL